VRKLIAGRSTKGLHNLALTIASLCFAIFAVFVIPVMADLPPVVQVLASAISLAGIVAAVEYLLVWLRAKDVLGEWVYYSSSGNWARVHIGISSGALTYKAQLYRTKAHLEASSDLWAVGEGSMVEYEGGNLYIRYEVKLTSPDYVPRDGFLTMVPDILDRRRMTGFWSRTSETGSGDQRGTLTISRDIPATDFSHG